MPISVLNETGLTADQIGHLKRLGHMNNKWRQRMVFMYEHPTDPDLIITCGIGYDGSVINYLVEPRTAYNVALEYARLGKVYIYD